MINTYILLCNFKKFYEISKFIIFTIVIYIYLRLKKLTQFISFVRIYKQTGQGQLVTIFAIS